MGEVIYDQVSPLVLVVIFFSDLWRWRFYTVMLRVESLWRTVVWWWFYKCR